MVTPLADVGGRNAPPPLFATLTRTLPRLGAGMNLFGGPMEPAGNTALRYHLGEKPLVDLTT
ncbi:MAG: hypothetical protein HQK87_04590 [Nitrospinae bacterium]|nr:hypothetical protein [Nitrospinota bacterium]